MTNILLIRLRLVGDVVFTTPAIRALRRQHPDARLTYLVESAAAPIVAANPHLDEVIVVPHRRGWRRVLDDLRLARALRAKGFDLVIDLHGGPRSSWLAWATGAPRRIGYTIPGRSWLYTDRVHRPRELRRRHSAENQWDLLAPLGVPPLDPERDPVQMVEPEAARTGALARLREAGVVPGEHTIIVIHVSAGNPFRRWPATAFATLAADLARAAEDRRIVITSGPSEAGAAEAVAAAARAQAGTAGARVVRCGEFDLQELRAVIAAASLYIGGDSGPLHVAATTRVPIVGLYGPTLPARSAPWRSPTLVTEHVEPGPLACRPCEQRTCVHGDYRCLSGIAPDVVAAAAERALARGRPGQARSSREAGAVTTPAAEATA
jgi:predicted lipopolysaccharide heptosyltransferase III